MRPHHIAPLACYSCLAAMMLFGASANSARAQTCVPGHHEVTYPGGSAKLRNYLCKIGDGGDELVRVTFHSLSEVMAGNLVMGEPHAELDGIIGKAELLKNEVYAEVETLFRKFGTSVSGTFDTGQGYSWSARVDTPPVLGASVSEATPSLGNPPTRRTLWYLSVPDMFGSSESIFLKAADSTIENTDAWPAGFAQFYTDEDPVSSTVIWKYIQPTDLDEIERDTDEWNKRAADEIKQQFEEEEMEPEEADGTSDEGINSSSDTNDIEPIGYATHFALFRHLAMKGWPADFMVVVGKYSECGSTYDFSYSPRPLFLDIALVENTSSKSVTVDDLLGARSSSEQFRPTSASEALRKQIPGSLRLNKFTLGPGVRVAVPLRIVFGEGEGQGWDLDEAQKVFERIRSLPAGTVLTGPTDGPGEYVNGESEVREQIIKKRRESFYCPTSPKVSEYVYGPEFTLQGLVIDGKTIEFESQSANIVEITVSSGVGSCPYLYSWEDNDKKWFNHGKVIDTARERKNKATQIVSVSPAVTRFRLAEEEPEVSYIDQAELRLSLRDGRHITLSPRQSTLAANDARYLRILAYRSELIEFGLPSNIAPEMIEKSELAITGYYRRYSTLMSELQSRAARAVGNAGQ